MGKHSKHSVVSWSYSITSAAAMRRFSYSAFTFAQYAANFKINFMKCLICTLKILLVLLHFIPAEFFVLYSSSNARLHFYFFLGAGLFGGLFVVS